MRKGAGTRAERALLALSVLVVLVHAALTWFGVGGFWRANVLYDLAMGVTALTVAASAWASTPGPHRRVRWWFAAALASQVAGEVLWTFDVANGREPFPSPADVIFLGFYPLAFAGLVVVVVARTRMHRLRRGQVWEGCSQPAR